MLKPGDTFERYTIEAPLGQGGMGAVYRAHDTRLGRRVALKVIAGAAQGTGGEAEADARLVREARAAAALDHPNAVSIFDVGEHEGAPFIVMELVDGRTLRSAVGDASLSLEERVRALADAARALGAAHKRGLVHRDVKPENVMLRTDGMVKVLDFGIARRAGGAAAGGVDPHGSTQTPALPTLTVDGVKLGTPVYMAPEQIRGDALDGRADQFAWGVVAYELLAGRLPWRGAGDAMAVMASVLTDPPDRAPLDAAGVPRALQDVVLRALEKRAEARYPAMEDVVRALDAASRGEGDPDPASPKEARERPPAGATEAQRFSTGEVRAVLARAVEREAAQQGSTKLRFEDLLAVGAEVGIDAESLREAARALRGGQEDEVAKADFVARRDAWLRQQRLVFFRHAGIYVIVNVAILILGGILHEYTPGWIWVLPALGWGIGMAIHGLVALTQNEEDFREYDEGVRWWRERQHQRHEERMNRRGRREERREGRRVEAPAPRGARFAAGPERVRVAPTDTGRERAAEEEAAQAEPRDEARKRR